MVMEIQFRILQSETKCAVDVVIGQAASGLWYVDFEPAFGESETYRALTKEDCLAIMYYEADGRQIIKLEEE